MESCRDAATDDPDGVVVEMTDAVGSGLEGDSSIVARAGELVERPG